MTARPFGHWLLLASLTLLWGSAFGLTKIAVTGFSPARLVSFRLVLAALLLTALVYLQGKALPASARFWRYSLAMAVVGNCLPFWLVSRAQQVIDSGLAGILMSFMPLTTLLLAHWLVPGEHLSRMKLLGFSLGLAGIVVLIGPDALSELSGHGTAFWMQLAVLFAAICYAANAIIARRRPAHDPIVAAAGTMLVGSLIMLPFGGPGLVGEIAAADPARLGAAVALAVLASGAAPVVFLRLVTVAGPSFTALMNYLIPLWALFLGMLLFDETPRWTALVALGLILGGIAISERVRNGRALPAAAAKASGDG